jgi:hypothetical protein
MLIVVLVMRVICRRPWIAYAAMYIIVAVVFAFNDAPWMMGVTQLLVLTLSLIVLTRLGLFAFVVAVFFSYWGGLPLTADPNSWFFTRSAATMAVFAAIAVYGFWVSLGDQKVFKQSVLDV